MWLNLDRVRTQKAVEVLRGVSVGAADEVPDEFMDSITTCQEEAEALGMAVNLPRIRARIMASLGR